MTEVARARILAVDDNHEALFALEQLLREQGYEVFTATDGSSALEVARREVPDLFLLDVQMPAPDGYEVTRELKRDPQLRYCVVVLLTGKDSLEDVVYGLEQGADDYIKKPYRREELLARVNAALRLKRTYETVRLQEAQIRELSRAMAGRGSFERIIGESAAMRELFDLIEKVADSDVPVLISGASGTGKELVATAVHARSGRAEKVFVAQNCSAFNENLLESELFGHVKGAFTGAIRDKQGLFEVADGGTFFLDELGEMSPALQVKLLRVLQEGIFIPVGATKPKKVDVRVVAATNRDLKKMVAEGSFREDLYYRLNVVNLKLPPLRERSEDIPLLVEHFLTAHARKRNSAPKCLSGTALEAFIAYTWPGNIRQLQNEIERLVLMSGKEMEISYELLSPEIREGEIVPSSRAAGATVAEASGTANLPEAIAQLERTMIAETLAKLSGNKSEAARVLGISRSSLISKVQSYGLEKELEKDE